MCGTSVRLLAKSGNPPVYLDDHTADVESALGQIRSIWHGLPASLIHAARFHDFGKAAHGFQTMLRDNTPWSYRHEVLSAAIFRQCFPINDPDVLRAYLALISHHKSFLDSDQRVTLDFRQCQSTTDGGKAHWMKKWGELNVTALRDLFSQDLSGWTFDPTISSPANDVGELTDTIVPAFQDLQTVLCRGALVAADHLASSGIGLTLRGESVARTALEAYSSKIRDWRGWKPIQEAAGQIEGSASLVAPTGAGKTEAALLWALNNRKGEREHARIFYVLPYQVSINAMADRISAVFPGNTGKTELYRNDNVSVLHSNSDLAYLQDALDDNIPPAAASKIARSKRDATRKIYSPIKVTTVYQLMDIFFGRKFFEVGLLELTNSLIVFDEIHAYDGHTLGLITVLLGYLQKLGAMVFIMTATLPVKLKADLLQAAGIEPANEIVLPANDPLLFETRRVIDLRDEAIEGLTAEISAAVAAGKKTAVVCNTVKKAILLAEALKMHEPLLVHSRFTIGDRAEREAKENIEDSKYRLVIATQVIEVSLDVSFDVMFTELAPVDALLQRFGRVNRHGDGRVFGFCIVACGDLGGSQLIYDPELMRLTRENSPSSPPNFEASCRWIEAVYPEGLAKRELARMSDARTNFEYVVAQLRPMLDQPETKLEANLFDSQVVVAADHAVEWLEHTKNGQHMEAKALTINVHAGVWKSAMRKFPTYVCKFGEDQIGSRAKFAPLIALFEYDGDPEATDGSPKVRHMGTGLRLDRPIDRNPFPSRQFL